MQFVALLKCLVTLCHVSSMKFLGLRMFCKFENLKAKLRFKIITISSVKVLSSKISLSSLAFSSCTTMTLYGSVIKDFSLAHKPQGFYDFDIHQRNNHYSFVWSLGSSKGGVYSICGYKTCFVG